jgi:predicted nucleic acid-binding protein
LLSNASVIVDTSVWVDYLRARSSSVAVQLEALISQRQVFLCGIVLAELLSGVRSSRERTQLTDVFRGLPYIEMSHAAWAHTGDLARALRSRGLPTPLSDLILATLALEHNLPLFTFDAHFQRVPRLRLHQPS